MKSHIFRQCGGVILLICIQATHSIEFMSQKDNIRIKRDSNESIVDQCSQTFPVNSVDNYTFTLTSNKSYCKIGFIGSSVEECTVEFKCTALHFENDPNDKNCRSNYVKLTDGLQGIFKTCNAEEFRKTPYRASRHGKDLYLKYKGPIKGTCTVSCAEKRQQYKQIFKTLSKGPPRKATACGCGEYLRNHNNASATEGFDAFPHEFPWMAALVFPATREVFCSGVLVNDRYVVSSAHCLVGNLGEKIYGDLKPTQFQILLHSHGLKVGPSSRQITFQSQNVSNTTVNSTKQDATTEKSTLKEFTETFTDVNEGSLRMNVKNVTIHPFYDHENLTAYDYDVAIIELEKPVDIMSTSAKPICLPTGDKIFNSNSKTGTIAGWGRTVSRNEEKVRKLQKLEISLLDGNLCSEFLGGNSKDATPNHRLLCGGSLPTGTDACGDGGGPLMYRFSDMKYRLIGIMTTGIGCSEPASLPGFYTNIQEVIQWIYKMTDDGVWCQEAT